MGVGNEGLEKITDFINPMRGMIKTVGRKMSDATQNLMKDALNKGAGEGSYQHMKNMPLNERQEIVNDLFSSRSLEEPYPLGMMGNQSANDVDYFGITTEMGPMDFLNLAGRRSKDSVTDKTLREDFAFNIAKDLANGKNLKIAPPYLTGDIREDKLMIGGHEGRHRSDAIYELFGEDVKVPVDMKFTLGGGEARRRTLDDSLLDLPITNQDGVETGRAIKDMLPAGFDTSALKKAEPKMSNDDLLKMIKAKGL